MKVKQSIEYLFEHWSEMVVSHRWWVLLGALLVTLAVVPQIRNGWVDVSIESFLPHDDPLMVDYNEFRQNFNYAPGVMITVEVKDGAFTLENLQRIKELHNAIEDNVPYLEKLTTLYNARNTRGENETLIVEELNEIWPETATDIPAFRELVLSNPNYVGTLISEDARVISFLLDPFVYSRSNDNALSGFDDADAFGDSSFDDAVDSQPEKPKYLQPKEDEEFSHSIFKLQKRYSNDEFFIHVAGGPPMNYKLAKDMEVSSTNATLLGFAIIIVLLVILFRRLSGVVLPLLVVFLSLAMTLALWPTLGYAYNGNTQIIPTFILAVGIADAIHILSIFYKHYDHGMEKNEAIVLSMKQTSIAVLMTTVTTAASLLSFLASDMEPTRTMGIFGAIGVVMALLYTLTLLPATLAIFPLKRRILNNKEKPSAVLVVIDKMIYWCGDFGVNHAKGIVIGTCLLAVVTLAGVMQITFSHDPIRWYKKDAELRVAIDKVDQFLNGSMNLQILLDTKQDNGLHDPKVLQAIEDIETAIETYKYKTMQSKDVNSILSVVKETHKALNNNNDDYYAIPDNKILIAQEMLLFENSSDDIYDFSDHNLQVARINVQLQWHNVLYYRVYTKNLKQLVQNILNKHQLQNVDMKLVGLLPIFGETVYAMLLGTVESYLLAFALVAFIMYLLMESLRRGLISFIPNMLPILITVGLMGWAGIPLNILTSTLGCVVIGISVDDTIHFMHHFRRYSHQFENTRETVHKTLETCGRAIVFTSIVLIGGFIVHLTGEFSVNKQFAILLSFAIFLALMANLILAPALMTLFWRKNEQAQTELQDC